MVKRLSGKKGIILLSVIIILLTVAIIGASLTAFFSSVSLFARVSADEAKASYLAEAGIAYAVSMMRGRTSSKQRLQENIGPVELGGGSYSVEVDYARSMIISKGEVRGAAKTIQLYYGIL